MTGPQSARPLPLSRRAGRATGRLWRRYGPGVRGASAPLRRGWSTFAAYFWFVAYMWVGLMLSVGGQRLTGSSSRYVLVAAVGGGAMLGYWQARHRLASSLDPSVGPMRRFGLALCAWLAVIGAAILLSLP